MNLLQEEGRPYRAEHIRSHNEYSVDDKLRFEAAEGLVVRLLKAPRQTPKVV